MMEDERSIACRSVVMVVFLTGLPPKVLRPVTRSAAMALTRYAPHASTPLPRLPSTNKPVLLAATLALLLIPKQLLRLLHHLERPYGQLALHLAVCRHLDLVEDHARLLAQF